MASHARSTAIGATAGRRASASPGSAGGGRRTDTSEILFEMAATITASLDLPVALRRLTSLAIQATGAERCVIFVDAGDGIHLIPVAADAVAAVADPARWARFRNRALVARRFAPAHHRLWEQLEPILIDDATRSPWVPEAWRVWGSRSLALVPLIASDRRHGLMAMDFVSTAHSFTAEERRLLEAIGSAAGAVIGNARMHEAMQGQLRGFEAMVRLTDVVTGSMDLHAGLASLNQSVCSALGISCTRASFYDRRLADLVGAPACGPEEREIIRTWRSETATPQMVHLDTMLVPIPVRGRIAGILHVRSLRSGDEIDRDLLGSIAAGIGEVATKARLAHRARTRSRELAVAEERERIIQGFHDTVGGILHEIGRAAEEGLLSDGEAEIFDAMATVRAMAADGGASVRSTIDTLAFLHMRTWGFIPAIRFLVEQQARMSGTSIEYRMEGKPFRVPRPIESALFRVIYEALTSLERHSRATGVVVTLRFEPGRLVLNVRDDGIGLDERMAPAWRSVSQFAIRGVARDLQRAGGTLTVQPIDPRGVSLTASVPIG